MSLVRELSERTLQRVVEGVGAREVHGVDGGPFLAAGTEATSGTMRLFTSESAPKIVATTLAVPARDVVTCMIFAFSPSGSALPHFTLDCGERPDGYAFHLDLMPRVELAAHLTYMDEVFDPLTPLYDVGAATPGLSATGTTRRQIAMMSPWMLVHLADESAFRAIDATVQAYAEHWLHVLRTGLTSAAAADVAGVDVAARDAAVRANLFSPEVDPVWGRVEAMIGPEGAATMRGQLQGPIEGIPATA
jgi:hypothetical protein